MKATIGRNSNRKGLFLTDAARILCAILLPPLSVYLTAGLTGTFWLNLALTVLGFVPGMVHAIWLLAAHGV